MPIHRNRSFVTQQAAERFANCVPGQAYRAYIDHIVLSRTLGTQTVAGSFGRVTFSAARCTPHPARQTIVPLLYAFGLCRA